MKTKIVPMPRCWASVAKRIVLSKDFWSFLYHTIVLVILAIGSYIGWKAYLEYRAANVVNTTSRLEAMGDNLYYSSLGEERGYIRDFLYYKCPCSVESASHSAKEHADRMLRDLCETGKELDASWKTIPELYQSLCCDPSRFNTDSQKKVTALLIVSERILYQVYDAYLAWQDKNQSQEAYDDFAAYIPDYSDNPLFLVAICIGHDLGYYSEGFATDIKRLLANHRIARELYPEMLALDWAAQATKVRKRANTLP